MKDPAKKLDTPMSRPSPSRLLRTAWAGTVAAVTAGGLLLSVSTGVQASPDLDGERPGPLHGLTESVPVEATEASPDGVSLAQVVAVLERSEQQAREQGASFSPTTAQAAAELSRLYTAYTSQQLTASERNDGPRLRDAPVVRPAVQVSNRRIPADGPDVVDSRTGQVAQDVTFDQVVHAAIRLANLLEPSVFDGLVKVRGADVRQGHSSRENLPRARAGGDREHPDLSLRSSLLDVVTMFGGSTQGFANGRIPTAMLCPLEFAPAHMLRCDAAERLEALSDEFEREFGYPIPMTDSYRTYVAQIALAGIKPHLAAVPGTSNHGWGLAVDLGHPIAGGASREYAWLRVHGPGYGWDNPPWARAGGSKPEPWHFEFFAAGAVPDRAVAPSDVGSWNPANLPDSSVSASARHEPAREPKPKDSASADGVRKRPAKPADESNDRPSPQKPAKPTTKPTTKPTPKPSEPAPKPTAPKPSPTPSPSEPAAPEPSEEPSVPPAPTPTPSEPAPPEPEPSEPAPSTPPPPVPPEPAPSPTPTPAPAPAPSSDATKQPVAPAPSTSPSPPSGLLPRLVDGPGSDTKVTED